MVETGVLSAISKEDDEFRNRGAKCALTARRGLRLVRGGLRAQLVALRYKILLWSLVRGSTPLGSTLLRLSNSQPRRDGGMPRLRPNVHL